MLTRQGSSPENHPHQDQWNGYLTTENVGYAATFRVPNDVEISYYEFNVYDVGTAGSTQIQYLVYDNVGAFVGNLFTTRPSIGAGAQFNTVIGRDVEGATTFNTNTTSITFNVGVLSITTLLAGYVLRPVINNFATASKGARFLMRLKEI